MRHPNRPIILTIVVSLLIFHASSGHYALAQSEAWVEDLDYLVSRLPRLHRNLFFQLSEADFKRQAQELRDNLPNLSREEIIVGLSQLVAAVGDSHTWLTFRPEQGYPLAFYAFQDGIYLLKAAPEYSQALHYRLIKVNSRDISDVSAALSTLIPHENQAQLKKYLPQYLIYSEMLTGLSIIQGAGPAQYTFVGRDGQEFTLSVEPVSLSTGLNLVGKAEYAPLYLKHPERPYWWEYLAESKTIYVNYSSCRNTEGYSVRQFSNEVLDFCAQNPVEKLIIDLRNNGGGSSPLLDPFIKSVSKNKNLNQPGKLYVIIGRGTFSSAILNALSFKNKTAAIFVGESTGGRPNHYGEVKSFSLPNSGLRVSYSTKYFKHSPVDSDSLIPDYPVSLTLADYEQGRDPVVEAILAGL